MSSAGLSAGPVLNPNPNPRPKRLPGPAVPWQARCAELGVGLRAQVLVGRYLQTRRTSGALCFQTRLDAAGLALLWEPSTRGAPHMCSGVPLAAAVATTHLLLDDVGSPDGALALTGEQQRCSARALLLE
jgi:hypothetical protein